MLPVNDVARILHEAGAVLVRSKKHHIYRLPNGKTFPVSASPSSQHFKKVVQSSLKRAMRG